MIILDTNIISEMMKLEPDARVVQWLGEQPVASLFITTITQAEILYGLSLLSDGKRKAALLGTAQSMFSEDFAGRILPFDGSAAETYPDIFLERRRAGKTISQFDAQIAAIAQSRGAKLATRNVNDFADCGLDIINPWQ
ncbi:type II toxin-antitoxin system VapC family toxin [Phyllobacterium meliloti]|uniref:type II toxin-antitoxin system VapC family toxin n=1 Tax=Phyllobacterium meliloti TaxID=555317 RepID=UPI001D144C59|nr:type II toxin-antitoxin system VapC family toxin [Phyllobacterium sp. T1293]UGX85477.1 type II toxin-antitoxin system VapC family toxin [Phyllobacterium sp. T1293]